MLKNSKLVNRLHVKTGLYLRPWINLRHTILSNTLKVHGVTGNSGMKTETRNMRTLNSICTENNIGLVCHLFYFTTSQWDLLRTFASISFSNIESWLNQAYECIEEVCRASVKWLSFSLVKFSFVVFNAGIFNEFGDGHNNWIAFQFLFDSLNIEGRSGNG